MMPIQSISNVQYGVMAAQKSVPQNWTLEFKTGYKVDNLPSIHLSIPISELSCCIFADLCKCQTSYFTLLWV